MGFTENIEEENDAFFVKGSDVGGGRQAWPGSVLS